MNKTMMKVADLGSEICNFALLSKIVRLSM